MIKKMIRYLILVLILAGLVVGGYFYYQHNKYYPNTDDAYIQAHVVYIAPQVTGRVLAVYVQNHQQVKTGQLLFKIDPASFKIAVMKAKAQLDNTIQQVQALQSAVNTAKAMVAERRAQLLEVGRSHHRIMTLVKRHLYSISSGDKATSELKVAKANLNAAISQLQEAQQNLGKPGTQNAKIEAAQAALKQAQLNLQYTTVNAPADGYVVKFNLQKGSEVTAYNQLFAIIEGRQWWARANFKETDLGRIRVGQSAIIKVDIYPGHIFHGIVKSISRGSGESFALLPPENASGNWVKVTQRFPVRVDIMDPNVNYPLRMGASCSVTINTTHLRS